MLNINTIINAATAMNIAKAMTADLVVCVVDGTRMLCKRLDCWLFHPMSKRDSHRQRCSMRQQPTMYSPGRFYLEDLLFGFGESEASCLAISTGQGRQRQAG